jgi:hypothetical protein
MVPANGTGKPYVWLRTPFAERFARFSPDGRWVSYISDATGQNEAYIRPFAGGDSIHVSDRAIENVRWSRDGSEIYYSTPDHRMYAVTLTHAPDGSLTPGGPRLLFQLQGDATMLDFDVSREGNFLLGRRYKSTDTNPITVMLNWR